MQTKLYFTDCSFLNDDEIFKTHYLNQSAERQSKIDNFKFRDSKNQSLGAGILFNKALSENGIDPKSITVLTNKNGKPYIKDNPFYFSISHSENYAVVAISDNPIGVDIETKSNKDVHKLAERFFDKESQNQIEHSSDKQTEFLKIWTKKESYTKMMGFVLTDILDKQIIADFTQICTNDYVLCVCQEKSKHDEVIFDNAQSGLSNV